MTAFLSAALLVCALALSQVQPWTSSIPSTSIAAFEEERGFLGVFLGESEGNGVTVSEVIADGAAERAGLQAGDLIQRVGDAEISNLESLQQAFSNLTVGSKVNVTFQRGGVAKTVKVKLGKRPDGELGPGQAPVVVEAAREPVEVEEAAAPGRPAFLGVELGEGSGGVSILNVVEGSPAAHSGLKSGDMIVAIEDQEIDAADQVVSAIQSRHAGDTVRIVVMRDGEKQRVKARLGARDAGEAEAEVEVAALERADVEQAATDRKRAEERAQREVQAAEREAQAAERRAQQIAREAEQVARRAEQQAGREAQAAEREAQAAERQAQQMLRQAGRALRQAAQPSEGAAQADSAPGQAGVIEEMRRMREELRALRREVERNSELLQALLSRQSTSAMFVPGQDSEVPATWLFSTGDDDDDAVIYELADEAEAEAAEESDEADEIGECAAECCSEGTDAEECDGTCDADEADDEDESAEDDDADADDEDDDDDDDDDEDDQDEDMPN